MGRDRQTPERRYERCKQRLHKGLNAGGRLSFLSVHWISDTLYEPKYFSKESPFRFKLVEVVFLLYLTRDYQVVQCNPIKCTLKEQITFCLSWILATWKVIWGMGSELTEPYRVEQQSPGEHTQHCRGSRIMNKCTQRCEPWEPREDKAAHQSYLGLQCSCKWCFPWQNYLDHVRPEEHRKASSWHTQRSLKNCT